jgi:ABC-2 type transport system permease protein
VSRVLAHAGTELRLQLRNGEQLLLVLGIPLGLLAFFGSVDVLPTGDVDRVQFLVPGVLALAVMSSAMVAMGIATGFERSYLVLKRLAMTPLGRPALVVAKILVVAALEAVQLVAVVVLGAALGWSPSWAGVGAAAVAVVLGTAAFAGIGLTLAGRLRVPVNLAAQNALYLVLLLTGGMVFTLDKLPGPVVAVARALPAAALADALRSSLGDTGAGARPWIVLAVWAVVAPLAAMRLFRWS